MKKITLLCAFMAVLGVTFIHAAPLTPVNQTDTFSPRIKDSAAKYYRLAMKSIKDPQQTEMDFSYLLGQYDRYRSAYLSQFHTKADSAKFMDDMVDSAGLKKDTAYVAVPVVNKTDTMSVTIETETWLHRLRLQKGHALLTGLKNGNQWVQNPSVVYVNKRYHRIKRRVLFAF